VSYESSTHGLKLHQGYFNFNFHYKYTTQSIRTSVMYHNPDKEYKSPWQDYEFIKRYKLLFIPGSLRPLWSQESCDYNDWIFLFTKTTIMMQREQSDQVLYKARLWNWSCIPWALDYIQLYKYTVCTQEIRPWMETIRKRKAYVEWNLKMILNWMYSQYRVNSSSWRSAIPPGDWAKQTDSWTASWKICWLNSWVDRGRVLGVGMGSYPVKFK
jgi:hypothetical protein